MSWSDRWTILLLSTVVFVSGADLLVITPTLPQLARELGVSVEVGGLWVTAYAIATATFALVFGPISDRYGRSGVLKLGVATLAMGSFACAAATSFGGLFAARALAGAGGGMVVVSATSYIGDHFGARHRAVAIGWVMTGFFLSLIVAVPIGGFLAQRLGWKNMFVCLGAVAAAVELLLLLTLGPPRHAEPARGLGPVTAFKKYAFLLTQPGPLGVLGMAFAMGLGMTMFSVFTSPWLEAVYGMNTEDRGLMYFFAGPAIILAGPVSGTLANRFGRSRMVLVGSCVMAVAIAIMPLTDLLTTGDMSRFSGMTTWGELAWPVAVPTALGFFLGMSAGSLRAGPFMTLALEVVPSASRGAMAALRNAFNHAGGGLGAALGGALWASAATPGEAYVRVTACSAVVNVAGALLLFAGVRRARLTPTQTPTPSGPQPPSATDPQGFPSHSPAPKPDTPPA